MDNIEILNYCIDRPETFLDEFYVFDEKHKELDKYVEKTEKIKHILISIKEVKEEKEGQKVLSRLYKRLWDLIDDTYSIYSEFGCFINACDAGIKDVIVDFELLKKITDRYIKKRTLKDIVPAEWVQALLDKGASRKKGPRGEKKLISILKNKGYVFVEKISDFEKNSKSVAKFKKEGEFSVVRLEKKFGEVTSKDVQGKILDLLIKNKNEYYFLEAKHIHVSGGAQNKQILELINIIKKKPKRKNHHFVSFLDGRYFNILFENKKDIKITKDRKNKISNQRTDIKKALKTNKNNYFINTAGFKRIFI